jgi:outer membrane protein TolC
MMTSEHYWKIPVQSYPAELLGGEPGSTVKIPIGTPWMSNYGINMKLKVLDIESINKIKLAVLQKQASEISLNEYRKVIEKNVTLAFYTVQIFKDKMLLSKEQLESYRSTHELIREQFEKGLIDRISLNQSKNILNDCMSQYLDDEQKCQSSMIELKFWMSNPFSEKLAIVSTYDIPLPHKQDAFVSELLPQFKSYQNEILIAKQNGRVTNSSLFPKLSLFGSYGQAGFGETHDKLWSSRWYSTGYIGVKLSFPLFSYKDSRVIKKQKEQVLKKQYHLDAYVESQKRDYLIKNTELFRNWENIIIKREQSKNSTECLSLSIEKVKRGLLDMIQLQTIQKDLLTAQNELFDTYIEYMKHYVDIYYLQNND